MADESYNWHSSPGLPSSCTRHPGIYSFQSVEYPSKSPWLLAERSPPQTHTHTHTLACTRPTHTFHAICSVSHFYICNPRSFVILPLHVSLKREKLISGVKRNYQMRTKSLYLRTKILMSTFHGNKKKASQSSFQAEWKTLKEEASRLPHWQLFLISAGEWTRQ